MSHWGSPPPLGLTWRLSPSRMWRMGMMTHLGLDGVAAWQLFIQVCAWCVVVAGGVRG